MFEGVSGWVGWGGVGAKGYQSARAAFARQYIPGIDYTITGRGTRCLVSNTGLMLCMAAVPVRLVSISPGRIFGGEMLRWRTF